jgi:hypothetical protein
LRDEPATKLGARTFYERLYMNSQQMYHGAMLHPPMKLGNYTILGQHLQVGPAPS